MIEAAERRSPAVPRQPGDHRVPANVLSRQLVPGRGGHASAEPIRDIVHNPPQPLTGEPCCVLLHRNTHWRS